MYPRREACQSVREEEQGGRRRTVGNPLLHRSLEPVLAVLGLHVLVEVLLLPVEVGEDGEEWL
jgi:hypothetical protein